MLAVGWENEHLGSKECVYGEFCDCTVVPG